MKECDQRQTGSTEERPFDDAEVVVEYETGVAHRAEAFRPTGDGGMVTHVREEWVKGVDGWRLVGTQDVRLRD